MNPSGFVPLTGYREYPDTEMLSRSSDFYREVGHRRSVRDFSDRPVSADVISNCLLAAGTAPNGANKQPWYFAAISNPLIKQEIRQGAEEEEREFYQRRASQEWLKDLEVLGTDANKPFLEVAPWLIVIFAQKYSVDDAGVKHKNYYVPESVGIATGLLITALHHAGLATLTHTPSPMKFLNRILKRPNNEKPAMILVAGYPADGVLVPDIGKKSLAEIAGFYT